MTVDVVISSSVQTAAVLPVDVDAIVSSDATEIERAQAEQLLAGVDADYLVMVAGTEVDAKYHAQVHDLINIVEDGAIESEAIYPTGTTDVLFDENDSRIQFKSDADRDAFEAIHTELCTLSDDVHAIRSADRSDITHNHDKTASIRRARRVIQTWTDHIPPVLEADENEQEQDAQANQQGAGDDSSSRNEGLQDAEEGASTDRDSQRLSQAQPPTQLPEDFDPRRLAVAGSNE